MPQLPDNLQNVRILIAGWSRIIGIGTLTVLFSSLTSICVCTDRQEPSSTKPCLFA